jgi:hypothetical protein
MLLQRLAEHAFKGLVVAILLEQRQARNGSVQEVIDVTRRCSAGSTGYAPRIRTQPTVGKERGLSSFPFSRNEACPLFLSFPFLGM